MMTWKFYAKAIAGALVAFLTAIATALTDGAIDAVEWITATVAAITALGVIWAVPNRGVAAQETPDGEIVAGPDAPYDIPEDTPVNVTEKE